MTTTSETSEQNTANTSTALSTSILNRIEQEHVSLVPKWKFLLFEYGMWALWGLSILIGAVSISVSLFVFMHAGFELREATHDGVFRFLTETLPYVWITLFILMAVLSHYNLRHTKRGYRYPLWQIVVSSIFLSLVGGSLLHDVGMGHLVETQAGRIPMFPAIEKIEMHMWQAPEEGRIVGVYENQGELDDTVIFTDKSGVTWTLDTSELNPIDLGNLLSRDEVRILGVLSSTTHGYFYGCAVFPWTFRTNLSLQDVQNERMDFLQRMEAHHRKVIAEMMTTGTTSLSHPSVCGMHTAVLRINREQ